MFFADVRLPDEIRIALEEGRLVIFAGAGISMPPPSSLPSFNGLAAEICGVPVEKGKEDRALGKAARNGTLVHEAVARRLYNPETHPTELHKQILHLFGTAKKVRIVTTNFDNHFSAAARTVFKKEKVAEYYAPALPLGDDFDGIVYLHGSARVKPQAMVLTDKNFGAAYLARGWARDFLVYLFSKFTVLFVGYSHNDVTISYLARGMNQAEVKRRWALVSSDLQPDGVENWKHLEIEIQQYSINPSNKENKHIALTDFFFGWAKHTKESIFDRSKRVKKIASALPPESETDSEYLDYCLHHPQLADDFCHEIKHPAWIRWMHAKGYFNNLFSDTAIVDLKNMQKHELVIGNWLSIYVRKIFPELLLELIEIHHQRLTPVFTQLLGSAVWVDDKKSPDPYFATWVSLLLAQGEQALQLSMWAYLLQKCKIPQHASVALRLFELLTEPRLHLRKHFDFPEIVGETKKRAKKRKAKKVDREVAWSGESPYWLNEAWQKVFQQNLAHIAEPLMLVVTKQLTFAHLLLRSEQRASETFDVLSWHRKSIAPHEQNQDSIYECLSVLVDAARNILDHWFKNDPARAKTQMETWWSSKIPLLSRLTAYGVGVDPKMDADERVEWLLKNDLLFGFGMKKEVFDILAVAYPHASVSAKEKLLRRIAQGNKGKLRRKLDAETIAYEQFNVLVWLRRSDKTCQLVNAAIEKIKALHPQFGEREHPDFDSWMGKVGFVDPKEGFNLDQILAEPPGQYLADWQKAVENSMRRDWWSYQENLKTLFSRNKEWGKGFMEALAKTQGSTPEMWNGVFWAWRDAIKSAEDWEWILPILEAAPENPAVFAGIAGLISSGIFKQGLKFSDAIITRAAGLMDKAWDICSKSEAAPDDNFHEWLTSAINHEGGWIGEFWVHYCSHLRELAGKQWTGVPANLKSKMQEALKGTSRVKVYARIAMTPWMGYIFAWDKAFAVENFLPLLDWKRNAVVAQQTWSVLLNYRRGGTWVEMEKQMTPYYQQFADRMTGMLKDATEKSEQFGHQALQNFGFYLANLAMWVVPKPVESGFFRDFLPRLPEKVRGSLAQGMGNCLEAMPPEKVNEIWGTWLKEYLDLRLIGVPVALSIEETKAIANWCLYIGDALPEAVQRIVQMPLKGVYASGIFDKLLKNPVLDRFPKSACCYVNTLMKGEDYTFLHDSLLTLHDKFKQTISGTPKFQEFEELLYLRGWKKK